MQIEATSYTPDVEALLRSADLPTADLENGAPLQLFAMRDAAGLIGVVGVEAHGSVGLLRSLAVAAKRRNAGHGRALVRHAEAWAGAQGIATLYLLTEDAARFFARLGYEEVPRDEAPAAVAATSEFAWACPSTATLMRRALGE